MSINIFRCSAKGVFVLIACVAAGFLSVPAAETNVTTKTGNTNGVALVVPKVVIPKSVFEDPLGKRGYTDPFFPKVAVVAVTNETVLTPPPKQECRMNLNGFSVSRGQKLVMINNATFASGEAASIKCADQDKRIKIKVLEIKETSVVIQLQDTNEKKELFLVQKN